MSSGGVMLTGWLRKSPPENKLKSRHHSWKKRWFVLKSGRLTGDPNVLEYSKYHTSKKPIKIIDLNDCKQIDTNVNVPVRGEKKDKDGNHFIFSIVTGHRTFYLIADSKREMSSWVQCLCDLCGFNYDSACGKDCIGDKQRTFMASPTTLVVHSPGGSVSAAVIKESEAESSAEQNAVRAPTVAHYSKTQYQNGNVNTSFRHSSNNGYDSTDQDRREHAANGAVHYSNFSVPPPQLVMDPPQSGNSSGDGEYLHLVDCETAPTSTLQLIDKGDQRRCSTDSVFTHEDSKPEDDLPDLRRMAPRFLDGGRLDSMPNVPPPAPPIEVNVLGDIDFGYDDDDDVVDARRPSKYSISRGMHGCHENLYDLPSRALHKAPDESLPWQNRSGSSFGSAKQLQSSEYVNTLNSKFSSSLSTTGDLLDSPSSANDAHSISSSASSRLVHESAILSPTFPIFPVKPHPDSGNTHSQKDTFNTQMLDVEGTLKQQEMEAHRGDPMPPARPPKPSELLSKDNYLLSEDRVFNGHVSPKHASVIGTTTELRNSEPQSLLLPTMMPTTAFPSQLSFLSSQSPTPHPISANPEDQATLIYDTPRPLQPNLLMKNSNEAYDHSANGGKIIDIGANPEFDEIENPGYEKMCGGGYMSTDAPCDDSGINFYTPMAGANNMTGPRFPANSAVIGLHDSSNSDFYTPPPVNRDLKPGRKSLGSDGGSSYSGADLRKNSCRDSFTSDEGLSPPHTTIMPSPQLAERMLHNHSSQSPVPINGGTLSPWNNSSRPPRPGHGCTLPTSPLVSPNTNQSRSPVHSLIRSAEKVSAAPERPPKPASMKYPAAADDTPIPPRRPPKPTETHNRKPVINPMPSAIVAPPDIQSDIQYIEVLPQHPHPLTAQEKYVDNDLVEYTYIDSSKTRALQEAKRERQGIMSQKTNPD